MNWEPTFISWAKGPGTTEQQKCDNAVIAVRKALGAFNGFPSRDYEVFPQGSYRARTNISQDSDVDVCIMYKGAFYSDYAEGYDRSNYGFSGSAYTYTQFKNQVEEALVKHFGKPHVVRGNKAFDIHENTYRVDADVIPAFEYRWYTKPPVTYGSDSYIEGIKLYPDNGGEILNFPNQTNANGVAKNDATYRKYKRTIRILKNLRNKMQTDGIQAADDIASFLIECLCYNAPNHIYLGSTFSEILDDLLDYLVVSLSSDQACKDWLEVNEVKYLFHHTQPWTRIQAAGFIDAARRYLGPLV